MLPTSILDILDGRERLELELAESSLRLRARTLSEHGS
jgi:hypothetical protein